MGTRRRGLAIGLGLVLASSVLGAGCSDGESADPTTTTAPPPSSTTTTPPPSSPPTTLPADATEVISTDVAANSAVLAGGSLWVAGTEDPDKAGADTLLRLDPATTQVTSRVDVGGAPLQLASVDDLLWVATSKGLARVDVTTEEVTTVDLGGPGRALAASAATVWVEVSRDGELDAEITAVDPDSLDTRTIAVSEARVAVVPDMASDGETLWVSVDDDAGYTVRAFDAASDEPIDSFDDPWSDEATQPSELELAGGELWICSAALNCVVADPATGAVVREASIPEPEGELQDLVVGEGSLWAGIAIGTDDGSDGDTFDDRTSAFVRVDPANGSVLGRLHEAAYPVPSLAVGDGLAFLVASANESRVQRELVRISLG